MDNAEKRRIVKNFESRGIENLVVFDLELKALGSFFVFEVQCRVFWYGEKLLVFEVLWVNHVTPTSPTYTTTTQFEGYR